MAVIADQHRHDFGDEHTVPYSQNRIRQPRGPGLMEPGKQWKLSQFSYR